MERTYKQPEVSLNPCCNGIYLIIGADEAAEYLAYKS